MLTHKMNRVLGLAVMGGLLLAGQSAMAGSIYVSHDFTGDSSTNWGWDSKVDPNSQLGGTNQLTYTYGESNAASYISSTITDGGTVFPDGTGTVVITFKLDVSHYPTGTFDYNGGPVPTVAEIAAPGNKGNLPAGSIASINLTGNNVPGQYRFGHGTAVTFGGGTAQLSNIYQFYTAGSPPTFALAFDVTWTVAISGSATTSWTVTSDVTLHGPINTSGTLGDIVIPTSTATRVDSTFHGWGSVTAYNVGSSGGKGTAVAPGDYILIDSFSAVAIPEPATLGLLALGGLLMIGRGKR
ncbi:MAG: PEP-CTERM sorting domain-containing protein [Phycisphaeraceae bacterium]